jgi:hypothetical protein
MAEVKGNLGEWSELLTLGTILVAGGGYSADENQNQIRDQFHKVLEVIIAENSKGSEQVFRLDKEEVQILSNGIEMKKVSKSELEEKLKVFLKDLTDGNYKKTFALNSGVEVMNILARRTISADSSETTSDLELVVEDPITGGPTPRSGFSIKSQLGQAATLLNSSGSTNIIYKVVKNDAASSAELPDFVPSSHKPNINKLYSAGYHLEFHKYQRDVFFNNLTYIDSQLPFNLAKVIINHYLFQDTNDYATTVERTYPNADQQSEQIIFKFKELLGAISMGLRPAKVWKGNPSKFKGLIVVKSDGQLLFYYLVTRLNFEEFLYKSVRFDRPDTSRHKYGSLYSENGETFIKLNFQIRFK